MSQPPRQLVLRMTSDPAAIADVRRVLEDYCRRCGLDATGADDVGLCVNEGLANIIRHAYNHQPNKPIHITADALPDGVQVRIRDWGKGDDPDDRPVAPYDPLQPGGLGLICLRTLMDEVHYEPQGEGMLLILTRRKRG